jgi:hypothetical protein
MTYFDAILDFVYEFPGLFIGFAGAFSISLVVALVFA